MWKGTRRLARAPAVRGAEMAASALSVTIGLFGPLMARPELTRPDFGAENDQVPAPTIFPQFGRGYAKTKRLRSMSLAAPRALGARPCGWVGLGGLARVGIGRVTEASVESLNASP